MTKVEEYLDLLDENIELTENTRYQEELFKEYVLRNNKNIELRKQLHKQYINGVTLIGLNGLRKQLAAIDLEYFGRAYLPHYFVRKSPKFHDELDNVWINGVLKEINPLTENKILHKKKGCRIARAAPRGHAKSTNFTFKDTLHAALYEYKHYTIILSDSSEQADGFLGDIKTEFEDNTLIKEDFGELKGSKCWTGSVIVTSTDIKIEAIGSGKKIRGRRHRNWRPDLIILDDVENDENVNTPDQRRKLRNWFNKAVSACGDTYTDIVYIGTILHYDSLLSFVLSNPEYDSKLYRAVISEATNTNLWEQWESIFVNLENDNRKEDAKTFFETHEDEMLEGTIVLWGEKLSYYELMIIKLSIGQSAFNSEYQNEPIDPETCTFNEEWFDYYEDELIDFSKPNFIFIGSNDPSLGKNKKSDTSSIVTLALDLSTGYMYIADASVEKRKADVIITDAIEISKRLRRDYKKGYHKYGVETVQFQYFFKEVLAERSREAGEYLPIEEIQSTINKNLRIESLQPLVKNKFIKFNKKHKTLIKQMTEYPMGKNDDAPDGLEMAVRLAIKIKGTGIKIDYKTVIKKACKFLKGAY